MQDIRRYHHHQPTWLYFPSSTPHRHRPSPLPKSMQTRQRKITGVMPSTGNTPYTYNWLISSNGGVSYSATTQCATNSGSGQASGNTVTCNIVGGTLAGSQNYIFELKVSDSASTPEITTSSASPTVAVAPQLTPAATPAASAPKLDVDQAETITGVIPSTGTSTYSYNWYESVNGGAYSDTTSCATTSGTGQISGNTVTCAVSANTLTMGRHVQFQTSGVRWSSNSRNHELPRIFNNSGIIPAHSANNTINLRRKPTTPTRRRL